MDGGSIQPAVPALSATDRGIAFAQIGCNIFETREMLLLEMHQLTLEWIENRLCLPVGR